MVSCLLRPVGRTSLPQRGHKTIEARFGARSVGAHSEDERLLRKQTVFAYALGGHGITRTYSRRDQPGFVKPLEKIISIETDMIGLAIASQALFSRVQNFFIGCIAARQRDLQNGDTRRCKDPRNFRHRLPIFWNVLENVQRKQGIRIIGGHRQVGQRCDDIDHTLICFWISIDSFRDTEQTAKCMGCVGWSDFDQCCLLEPPCLRNPYPAQQGPHELKKAMPFERSASRTTRVLSASRTGDQFTGEATTTTNAGIRPERSACGAFPLCDFAAKIRWPISNGDPAGAGCQIE